MAPDRSIGIEIVKSQSTHNHPEGMKGAAATAAAVFLARTGNSQAGIRGYVAETFGYDMTRTIDEIRPGYRFEPRSGSQ